MSANGSAASATCVATAPDSKTIRDDRCILLMLAVATGIERDAESYARHVSARCTAADATEPSHDLSIMPRPPFAGGLPGMPADALLSIERSTRFIVHGSAELRVAGARVVQRQVGVPQGNHFRPD